MQSKMVDCKYFCQNVMHSVHSIHSMHSIRSMHSTLSWLHSYLHLLDRTHYVSDVFSENHLLPEFTILSCFVHRNVSGTIYNATFFISLLYKDLTAWQGRLACISPPHVSLDGEMKSGPALTVRTLQGELLHDASNLL